MAGQRKDAPDAVDVHVGHQIRVRRLQLGLNQSELGRAIGVTFQQIQKYEKGDNRVSASMLFRCATVLGCTPADFFPEVSAEPNVRPVIHSVPGGLELENLYLKLPKQRRKALLAVAEALASHE